MVGVGTGALNAVLILPAVRSWWTSAYGGALLIKLGVLVPGLVLATFHRGALRRLVEQTALILFSSSPRV